jgi:hypothetical protein
MSELITVDVLSSETQEPIQADSYDYQRLPAELRDQAMLAQGTVLTKLGGAVERVIDAGNTLRWAKDALPHGEYLPWVQQACGLKPQYAQQLVKAAEWVNAQHVGHLDGITDTATLFLLSADATPEDVREWVMERCAAGNPPTRKEVQERKRAAQGKAARTLTQEVKAALKISLQARQLAAKAEQITTRQLMDELDADDLPKGVEHQTQSHQFFKNGTGWWKLPIEQPVETAVTANLEPEQSRKQTELLPVDAAWETISVTEAAQRMGFDNPHNLRTKLTPSALKKKKTTVYVRNGWEAARSEKEGKCLLRQLDS